MCLRARFALKGLISRIQDDRNPRRVFRARPGLGTARRAPTRKQIVQSAAWGLTPLSWVRRLCLRAWLAHKGLIRRQQVGRWLSNVRLAQPGPMAT